MSKTSKEHKIEVPKDIIFSIIIISSSRFQNLLKGERVEDTSGRIIIQTLQNSGYTVASKKIIADDKELIERSLKEVLTRPDIDVVITSGGTGISNSDISIETIKPLFDKELTGFGELMRMISYEEIGSSAILTRAVAGIIGKKPVFCIPGSPHAVDLALTKLIIPEIGHIVKHINE
jgi:molybdenum cofactor biosynthesis protein B